ncbi:MAG: phosphomannomutase/phosphoglucomutase [Proteobacteria bacterium]|nr:phosphomannomutase/phosphoglucomutase [Pseudomonadota bacterium]
MTQGRALHPTILREYDIRGIVDETLYADDVFAVGQALGTMVARQNGSTVAVGYDGRLSSPRFAQAMVEGLMSCGMTVYRVGLGPTPMLYYAAKELGLDAGAMITGSHNPPDYNGIKIMMGGDAFYGEQILELGSIAAKGEFASGSGKEIARPVMDDYVTRLLRDYEHGRDLVVAWDAGNGAMGDVLRAVAAKLPGRHLLLYDDIDGTFPNHHPDPTVEKNLEDLKGTVRSENCDLGIAFDGDGDRIGVVDGTGTVLWGDQILVVLANEVLKAVPGATIIADVKASQVLFDEIARMGGDPVMWKTGHSLIKSKMAELGSPLAGEMSGHIFFGHKWYGFDDAMYAALRLISIVSRSDKSLAEMREAMPHMINTPELRFDCPEERKFEAVKEVKERLGSVSGIQVNDIDGVRVNTDDGWWLLRASNTQAVLVARCESSSQAGMGRLKAMLVEQLKASGVEPPDFG